MAFTEKITLLVDVVTGNSKSSLGKLKTDLAAADGAFGKTKVAAAGLGDFLKKNAALGVAAVGTAVATFAVKAVGEFQDVALGAGKLASSLGITTEEASRLQEVASDLGVGVSTMERGLGRMNREIANSPEAFAAIGAEIAKTSTGATDVTQTFLNVIDALRGIEDPAKRAAAAQKVLGRGWQDMSRIIALGADDLTAKLASVEESKIISEDEVEKAEEFRDTMDELRGRVEELTLQAGGALLPVFIDLAEAASDIAGPFTKLAGAYADMRNADEKGEGGWFDKVTSFFTTNVFGQIDQATNKWEHLMDLLGGGELEGSIAPDLGKPLFDAAVAADAFEERVGGMVATQDAATQASIDQAAALDLAKTRSELLGAVLETEAQQQQDAADAARDHADALLEAAGAAQAEADAARAAADAGFALEQAQRESKAAGREVVTATLDLAEAQQAYNETVEEHGKGSPEATQAYLDIADALDRVAEAEDNVVLSAAAEADAQVRLREERANARGEVLSATESLGTFNRSLLDQAAAAEGPARKSIVDYLIEVNKIPPKKASRIEALIDQGKVNKAKNLLDDTSRTRTATVTADANTAAAQAELDALDDPRTSTLTVHVFEKSHRQHGGKVPAEGELAVVGEAGPELVALPGGSRVYTNSQSKRMLGVQSFQHGGTVRRRGQAPRAARLEQAAEEHAEYAKRLRDEAKALKERAKAMEDGEEKDKVLEQADRKLDQANTQLEKSTTKAGKAAEAHAKEANKEAKALHADADEAHRAADALRVKADAGRAAAEVAAEGMREQSTSLREAADAQLAFEDAQTAAAEAAGHAARAFEVEGVTAAQQAEALNDAKQAALALADAEVERARQLAEARGQEFDEQDQARVMEASLRRQARRGGDVGKAINDLIKTLDFTAMMRGFDRADARERKADARADKEEARAKVYDKAGNQLDRAADTMERLANALPETFENLVRALGSGRITDREFDRKVQQALNRIAQAARAG